MAECFKFKKYWDHRCDYGTRSGKRTEIRKESIVRRPTDEREMYAHVREAEIVYLNQRPFWGGFGISGRKGMHL